MKNMPGKLKPIRNVEIFITSGTEPVTNNVAKTIGVCVPSTFCPVNFHQFKRKMVICRKKDPFIF